MDNPKRQGSSEGEKEVMEGHGSEEGREEEEDLSNLVKSLTIDVVHL